MFATIKKMLLAAAVLVPAALASTTAAHAQRSEEFYISNESSYRLDHIYISSHNSTVWGEDQLGRGYLDPNYHISFYVEPGRYDVKMVDKDGDSCTIPNVAFYRGVSWTVTDTILLSCEALTR